MKRVALALLIAGLSTHARAGERRFVFWGDDGRGPQDQGDRISEFTSTRYYISGTVGTLVGFGMGHGLQYRAEEGLTFAYSEMIAGFVLALAMFEDTGCTSSGGRPGRLCKTVDLQKKIGLWSLVGLKIWEAIDVWSFDPKAFNEGLKPAASLGLAPLPGDGNWAANLQLRIRF